MGNSSSLFLYDQKRDLTWNTGIGTSQVRFRRADSASALGGCDLVVVALELNNTKQILASFPKKLILLFMAEKARSMEV